MKLPGLLQLPLLMPEGPGPPHPIRQGWVGGWCKDDGAQMASCMSRMAEYGMRMAGPMLVQTETVFHRAPLDPLGLLASTDSCTTKTRR